MTENQKLKIAFLVGSDNASTRLSIERVCALPGIEPAALLLDTQPVSLQRRVKNLVKNVRREGMAYALFRIVEGVRSITDSMVGGAVVSHSEVRQVLKKAFPAQCWTLADLSARYGFSIIEAGNLNGNDAIHALKKLDVDLGVVIGTRVLKEGIFSVPRMGCINLHKGKVPEYRGLPPGFWELWDGAKTAGITIHFVDKGLDTGDIVAASEVPVESRDTPSSLREKLHVEGAHLLAGAVAAIQAGNVRRIAQTVDGSKARSKPTRKQVAELQRKLPHWKFRSDISVVLKNAYCLFVFYSGLYALARFLHRKTRSRCAVLLYHRVNDFSQDVLTVDTETFAGQLLAISSRYSPMSTSELVSRIHNKQDITPTSVVIHFDDCYRDVWTHAAPILKQTGFSATAFVSSGFIGTARRFAHDVEKYPFIYENLEAQDIQDWLNSGFEIGSHTVNHVDLGHCSLSEAKYEVSESLVQLEKIAGRPIPYFSFPFGRIHNINTENAKAVVEAGYSAMFSAHGGFVNSKTNIFDIPRMGAGGEVPPLYLLLEIEALTPNQVIAAVKRTFTGTLDAPVRKEPLQT